MGYLHEMIDVLKGMSVSVTTSKSGTVTPTVYDIDEAKGHAQRSGLPLRFFSPFADTGNMRASLGEWGLGSSATITWTITDRLLWRELEGGVGLEDVADNLAQYLDNYMDAAKALEWAGVGSTNAYDVTVEVVLRSDIIFPAAGGKMYVGADAVWTIREVDP